MPDWNKFNQETLDFLLSIAPGNPESKVKLSKNPLPWPKSWCPLRWDKGRIWDFFKYGGLWRAEDVFKEPLSEVFVKEDGTPKKFVEIGTVPNREKKHLAIGVTDVEHARALIYVNDREQIYFEDHPLLRVLLYDEKNPAWEPLAGSASIPLFFSIVNTLGGQWINDGGTVNYLPSSWMREGSKAVQLAVSCIDLELPRHNAWPGTNKYKFKNIFSLIENIVYSSLISIAQSDMNAFYEGGNQDYCIFEYKEISDKMSTTSFNELNVKNVTIAFNLGLKKGRNSINNLPDKDKVRAFEQGFMIAFSGGGTLFPAMFGYGCGAAEAAWNLKAPYDVERLGLKKGDPMNAVAKAFIGGSGGGLASAYLAEKLPV